MYRLFLSLIILSSGACQSSSPAVLDAEADTPPAPTPACTFGFTRTTIQGGSTVNAIASDGTDIYAIVDGAVGGRIDGTTLVPFPTNGILDLAGGDGEVFYVARLVSTLELHSFTPPSTDVKLATIPASGGSLSIDVSSTTIFVRGLSDATTITLWTLPRAGGTLTPLVSYSPAQTLGRMRAGESYVTWDDGSSPVIVSLAPVSIVPMSAVAGDLHTLWKGDVYGERQSVTGQSTQDQMFQLTPTYQLLSTQLFDSSTAVPLRTFFGDGDLLVQNNGTVAEPQITWGAGECNFDPATFYRGDANRLLAVDSGAVLAIQTH